MSSHGQSYWSGHRPNVKRLVWSQSTDRSPLRCGTKRSVNPAGGLPFDLQPIRKVETFRAVLDQLSSFVEHLQPGDRLGSERELATRLHVSRVTVREALRALEGMGKVDIRRNSGTFVARPAPHTLVSVRPPDHVDDEYVRYLCDIRAGIECEILRVLSRQASPDLSTAEAALVRAEREIAEETQQGSLDTSFEAGLGHATGNPVLMEFQQAIHELWLHAWITLGGSIANRRHLHEEHLDIVDALKNGEHDLAERRMREHITGLEEDRNRI
ncbi:MAG: FCD domain-containing protein [Streptosporangiales bacterium]|nr:FCD domain-containing protein [Streptosporangiales bacterium]